MLLNDFPSFSSVFIHFDRKRNHHAIRLVRNLNLILRIMADFAYFQHQLSASVTLSTSNLHMTWITPGICEEPLSFSILC
jgi:hypothetical protein